MPKTKITLVLLDIRSSHNVGSIFRTADAVGVENIILVGTTPCPIDRFGRAVGEIKKTALGAELSVPWSYEANTADLFEKIKKEKYLVMLEQDNKAINYKNFDIATLENRDIAIVVGNEVSGIDKSILEKADAIIEIPMKGKKESLNVSVATGIALYHFVP